MNFLQRTLISSFSRNYSSVYKSSISLENLYPKSSLLLTNGKLPLSDGNKFNGFIPVNELEITYSRSSGPGGQNVNKVNTKVDIRFHLQSATWIPNDIKTKLAQKLSNKINKDGYLIFKSDVTRSQQLNVADCLQKIRSCIRSAENDQPAALEAATQEKIRRNIEKSARERLAIKRHRSQIKNDRQNPPMPDN